MRFSLINVHSEADGIISGNWIQDHIGTLETAKVIARKTEEINSNKITVAVISEVSYAYPSAWFTNMKRLD